MVEACVHDQSQKLLSNLVTSTKETEKRGRPAKCWQIFIFKREADN